MENFNPAIHEKINGGYQLKQTEQSAVRIRQITKGAFRRRLTTAEKVAIKSSTNPVVKVLEDDLLATSFVDLDGLQLIDGLAYLESLGILSAGRASELLADGQQSEAPSTL